MAGSRSTLRIALALAAASVGLAGLAWLVRDPPADPARIAFEPPAVEAQGQAVRVVAPAEAGSARAPSVETAKPAARETEPPETRATAQRQTIDFVGSFVLPNRKPLELALATVELVSAAGERRRVSVERASSVRIEGVACDRWTVDVEATGHRHLPQVFDLAPREEAGPNLREEKLVLWPEHWVAVVARTSDGRPFHAIADEIGVEPKRLFVAAFELRVRSAPPDEYAWEGKPESLATIHPPAYPAWERQGGGVLGSLELHAEPPMWVGVRVHGLELDWQRLAPAMSELVFVLDRSEFERRFARIALRVVDATSGAPVAGAKVTVRADSSKHRRPDLENVATGADGRVEISRVIPGGHEVSVVDGKAVAQDHVALAAGETRDLGDVALARGEPIPVLVRDEQGALQSAYVEVGRFADQGRVSDLYPQMLRYRSDGNGRFEVPRPSSTTIVRASTEGGRSTGRIRQGPYSANVLVAADAPSSTPIVLVLREPLAVRFETHASELGSIEIEDEIGVVVDWMKTDDKGAAGCDLLAGRYRAKFLDARGKVLGEAPFDVRDAGTTLTWP